MIFIIIRNRQILLHCFFHFFLKLIKIHIRFFFKFQYKPMTHVRSWTILCIFIAHKKHTQIFQCMCHFSVFYRFMHDPCNVFRKGTKYIWSCDDDFFPNSYQQICISVKKRINQIKVFHDHHFPIVCCFQNGLCQHMHLCKCRFKADVQMISMG